MSHDNVNNPKHYAGGTSLECIEAMRITFGKDAVAEFCLCNAYKYLWRHKLKNGKEDLEKAKWYIDYINANNLEDILTGGQLDSMADLEVVVNEKLENYSEELEICEMTSYDNVVVRKEQ